MAKILVIDDVMGVRRSTSGLLRKAGHEIVEAADGRDGIEKARATRPDLVITDLLMPGIDGLDTIDGLREAGVRCPILAVSGGGALVDATDALAAAANVADATLRKPFDSDELLERVDALLAGQVGERA
jgi:CheY-like chemotaxis protein